MILRAGLTSARLLALVARDAAKQPVVTAEDGQVVALLKDYGDGLLIAVNLLPTAVRARITVLGVTSAESIFEPGRSVAVSDALCDDFAPYGVKVYQLHK